MSRGKKESYVSYLESDSRSISSRSRIKEFLTPHYRGKFALARQQMRALTT
jgi:hypothetical protein